VAGSFRNVFCPHGVPAEHRGRKYGVGLSGANGAADSHTQVLAQPLPALRELVPTFGFLLDLSRLCHSTTTFGTVARNSFRGPEYFNTDLSLRKNFQLYEGLQLQIGANAYNVLNHPNFSNPYGNLDSEALWHDS